MDCPSIALIQVVVQIVLFSTANSQTQLQPIVNVDPIQDGRPFTITCAADRVILGTQDPAKTQISELSVYTNTTDSPTSILAQYHPSAVDPNDRQYTKPGLPVGWIVNFSGGVNATGNRQSIKIEIIIPKATCSQAGLYTCGIAYLDNGLLKPYDRTQNVTAEAATEEPVLTLLPQNSAANAGSNYSTYDLGETVTMTCRVTGQKNLGMKWRREARGASGSDPYEDYPVQTDITTVAPVETQSSGACSQFTYVSVLKFNVSAEDTKRIYRCIISGDNIAPLTVSATIDVVTVSASVPPATGTQDDGPSKGSVGMIVGIVIGSVVAVVLIIIVICCVCHRRSKKKKEDNYPDQPDGDVTPPPYPHVPARTPYETNPYNRGGPKVTTGKTNRGLDASFESANKPSTVYAINNNDEPPLRSEYDRKYVNLGYDEANPSHNVRSPPSVAPKPHVAPKPQVAPRPQVALKPQVFTEPEVSETVRVRRYSTEDGTDDQGYYYGNEDFGTNV